MDGFDDHYNDRSIHTDSYVDSATQTDNETEGGGHLLRSRQVKHCLSGSLPYGASKQSSKNEFIPSFSPCDLSSISPTIKFRYKAKKVKTPMDSDTEEEHEQQSNRAEPSETLITSDSEEEEDKFYSLENSPITERNQEASKQTPMVSKKEGDIEKLAAIFLQQRTTPILTRRNHSDTPPPVFIMCPSQPVEVIVSQAKITPELTEEFIEKCNKEIDGQENLEIAKQQLHRMLILGGLEKGETQRINIPEARLGLCLLAKLKNVECKNKALDSLYLLLKNAPVDKTSADLLVDFAMSFMKERDRHFFQTQPIDTQVKIAKIYNVLADILQQHYIKQHTNAMTETWKMALISTMKALKDLNTQNDYDLTFEVKCALCRMRNLKSDNKELISFFERVWKFAKGLVALVPPGNDTMSGFSSIEDSFRNLDPHLKKEWFGLLLVVEELSKEAMTNIVDLRALEIAIQNSYRDSDWKFSYGCIQILTDIALNGKTEEIRRNALNCIEQLGFQGEAGFSGLISMKDYISWKPLIHLSWPKKEDPTIKVRFACVKNLLKIVKESHDIAVRKRAKTVLYHRYEVEKDPLIKKLLNESLPERSDIRLFWQLHD